MARERTRADEGRGDDGSSGGEPLLDRASYRKLASAATATVAGDGGSSPSAETGGERNATADD